jgi:tRNA(fMet)-specific endonuclease VapC
VSRRSPRLGERLGIVGRGRIYSVYIHGESDEACARLSAITDLLAILSLPKSAGESYGEIQADLESKGEMIGNNDLWIAAHALAAGLTLVTNNKEFRRV